jgi:HEAT repeat protein
MSHRWRWVRRILWVEAAVLAALLGFFAWRQTVGGHVWALSHEDPDRRREAWDDLARLGPAASKAIPEIIEAMRGPDERTQVLAASTLRQVGGLQALTWATKHPDQAVRLRAVEALSGRDCRLGAFIDAGRVRWREIRVFSGARPDLAAVPTLCDALKDPSARVRECAVDALGSLGPSASGATPDLVATLRDPEAFVRIQAVHALGKIGAIEPVAAALADPEAKVRQAGVVALASLGRPDVLQPLTVALRDPNGWVANSAADALEQAMNDPDQIVRESARAALTHLSDEAGSPRAGRARAAAR